MAKKATKKTRGRSAKSRATATDTKIRSKPVTRSSAKTSDPQTSPADGEEHLDKIRDILVGSQMRESDKRFGRLEKQLSKEITSIREEFTKRHDSLEAYIKTELQSLVARVKAEQAERAQAVKDLVKSLADTQKAFEKKLAQLSERSADAQSDLREQILDQSKNLRQEIHTSRTEIKADQDHAVGELRNEKTDRSALANLFTEVAMRLSDDGDTGT